MGVETTTAMAENTFNFGAAENLSFAKCITCASEEAREVWAHGFGFMLNYNHEMAIGKYMECLEKDPKCAMAHWGIAYSLSSSYNWPPGLGSGHDSCEAANGLKEGLSELEVDLIEALATRHSAEAKASAAPAQLKMGNDPELNKAFAAAMEPVFEKYKTNLDVTAVYVEALMNLKPWALWDKEVCTGDGQSYLNITPADENTSKLITMIETALGMTEANTYTSDSAPSSAALVLPRNGTVADSRARCPLRQHAVAYRSGWWTSCAHAFPHLRVGRYVERRCRVQ